MKFTLGWLRDHLASERNAAAITQALTRIGLEVESFEDRAAAFAPFVVGAVVKAEQHPDADRLRVCWVDAGQGEPVQVVCGAPNARAGMKGVFAPAGTRIPGTGVDLKKSTIRGVESNGMLLSERELGLSEDHEGIVELPQDAAVGSPAAVALGLADPVIDIAVTPNRPDALGVRGVARDLAAAGLGQLQPWRHPPAVSGTFQSPIRWHRDLPAEAGDACPFVVGRYFRNLRNGSSPEWMQRRLEAIGLRPISALVDITNYVTHDLARPLHVFDADRLGGDLTMRLAAAGEEIEALDGRTYRLEAGMTVIAGSAGVYGIGGIMGGARTGCTPETRNVFLEVALFDRVRTAATGRRLGIISDARYRFERGVDPESALWGAEVAAHLIQTICGGEASDPVSAGAMPQWRRRIGFRPSRLQTLGGIAIPAEEARRILAALGFSHAGEQGEAWLLEPPSWRPDIEGEADIVEEVLRIHGYDRIPAVSMRAAEMPKPMLTPQQRRVRLARRALASRGLCEAVTWSFMSSRETPLFGGTREALRLLNPISAELDEMRPSILPNLLRAAQRNADRRQKNVMLFEVGPQYAAPGPEGQAVAAAGLRQGSAARHWADKARPADAFDAKADAMAALDAVGAPVGSLQTTPGAASWYHPGRSGSLKLGTATLAWFGEVHPRVLHALDVDGPVAAFEAFLDRVPPARARAGKARPLLQPSPFQPVERDFAFVVDQDLPVEKLVRAAQNAEKTLIAAAEVFDSYAGPGIPEGKKSVAFALTIQPLEKTLTEAEIEAIAAKVVAAVQKQTGGVLRT